MITSDKVINRVVQPLYSNIIFSFSSPWNWNEIIEIQPLHYFTALEKI